MDLRLHLFLCVVVIHKKLERQFLLGCFCSSIQPDSQLQNTLSLLRGFCLLDHHGWEFYGDHNACDHASVHGTAMWGSHCCCICTSSGSSQPHALRGWEEEHPTWSGMEWDKECPKRILYLIHHVMMMMMMMRQFCLRDGVYLAFRSRCYAYCWVQINTYILSGADEVGGEDCHHGTTTSLLFVMKVMIMMMLWCSICCFKMVTGRFTVE